MEVKWKLTGAPLNIQIFFSFNILKVSFAFECKNVVVWLIKKKTDQTLCDMFSLTIKSRDKDVIHQRSGGFKVNMGTSQEVVNY